MARYDHLPIYKEAYSLLVTLMETTKNFPKDYKYTLGEKLQNHVLELIVDIYKANNAQDKKVYLASLLEHVQFINLFLRISMDLKIIPLEKYTSFIAKTSSVAKQAQGWLQSLG